MHANVPYCMDDIDVHAADSFLAPAQTNLFVTTNQNKLEIMNQVMISPRKVAKVSRKVNTSMDIAKMNRKLIISKFAIVNYRKIPEVIIIMHNVTCTIPFEFFVSKINLKVVEEASLVSH